MPLARVGVKAGGEIDHYPRDDLVPLHSFDRPTFLRIQTTLDPLGGSRVKEAPKNAAGGFPPATNRGLRRVRHPQTNSFLSKTGIPTGRVLTPSAAGTPRENQHLRPCSVRCVRQGRLRQPDRRAH